VRICSNIPRVATLAPTAELLKAGYSVAPKTVMFFGSGHPSVLFDYVEAAFARLLALDPEVQLIIVGMDARKLHSLCPSLVRFGRNVQTLGFVPARDVSLWLQVAELVLAPLVEGVNARKGTIMAAMQHGRPVVTTRGFHTRDDIPWDQLCALSSIDREVYAELSARCFLDSSWRERLGQAARADYEKNASASVSAARLLSLALGADTG
jgi:glycosyltransferase involved in cell wall biosynthesis